MKFHVSSKLLENFEEGKNGEIQFYKCYHTKVKLTQDNMVPMKQQTVNLRLSRGTDIRINGDLRINISPNATQTCTTDQEGCLHLEIPTSKLECAHIILEVNTTSQQSQSSTITIIPDEYVMAKLRDATVSGSNLLDATGNEGKKLIPENSGFRSSANNVDAIAKTLNAHYKILSTQGGGAINLQADKEAAQPKMGLRYGSIPQSQETKHLNLTAVPDLHTSFSLDLSNLAFTTDPIVEYTSTLCSIYSNIIKANGLLPHYLTNLLNTETSEPGIYNCMSLWEDIKKAECSLENYTVNVISESIEGVENAIHGVVTIVKEGLKRVVDFIATTAEEIGAIIEGLWVQIKITFQDLFNTFAYVFDWNDIKHTKDVIKHYFIETAATLPDIIKLESNRMNSWLESFHIPEDIYHKISKKENYPFSQKDKDQEDDHISHNIILNHMKSQIEKDKDPTEIEVSLKEAEQKEEHLKGMLNDWSGILPQKELVPEIQNSAKQCNKQDDQSLMRETTQFFYKIFKPYQNQIIAGLQKTVTTFATASEHFIVDIIDGFKTKIDIPILSKFYFKISGDSLSLLDLWALVIAVSVTIGYKVLYKETPFSEDNVKVFKRDFTNKLLQSHINSITPEKIPSFKDNIMQGPELSTVWQTVVKVFKILAGVCFAFRGLANILQDGVRAAAGDNVAKRVRRCDFLTIGGQWLQLLWGCPYFGGDHMTRFGIPSKAGMKERIFWWTETAVTSCRTANLFLGPWIKKRSEVVSDVIDWGLDIAETLLGIAGFVLAFYIYEDYLDLLSLLPQNGMSMLAIIRRFANPQLGEFGEACVAIVLLLDLYFTLVGGTSSIIKSD